jgi:hypothetical protein
VEGDDNNIAIAFCFGLTTAKKATTELPSPSLLQQAFFLFVATQKATVATLPSPLALVLLQQRK